MKDEALRLALEALKHGGCPPDCKDGMTDSGGVHPWGEAALIPCPNCKAITAIKQALEQPEPEPEPVAWMDEFGNIFPLGAQRGPKYLNEPMKPLYTSPPKREWQGLTGDERDTIVRMAGDLLDAICLTESKLEEKNT